MRLERLPQALDFRILGVCGRWAEHDPLGPSTEENEDKVDFSEVLRRGSELSCFRLSRVKRERRQ